MGSKMSQNKKPLYQPWNEEEFQADVYVRGMTPAQKWMYRTLLQASFFHTTRPYLPIDDEVLWVLAGCESPEQWEANKARVLKRFDQVDIDGTLLLENKRVTADWIKLLEFREEQSERGQRRVAVAERAPGGQFKPGKPGLLIAQPPANQPPATAGVRLDDSPESASRVPAREEKVSEVKVSEDKVSNTVTPIGSDWGNLRRSYRKFFSKKPDKSRFGRKYDESCDTYGEPIVLACFEQWAGSVGDVVKSFDHPLHSFFKKLSDLAADELESQKEEQIIAEHKKQEEQIRESEQVAVEESVAQQKREYNERMDAVTVAPNEASALDYLADLGYTPEEIEAERLKIEKRN
jgi:hypothetical protein